MFNRKEDIDQEFFCGICDNIYKNPRVLPCSESACHECIQSLIQSDSNKEFDCNFCHKKHTLPDSEGFPLNGVLMRLLKARAGYVFRNPQIDELKSKLDEIKSQCDELKLGLDNGVDQVREYCTRLRNQIHLETDVVIEEAHKFNEGLIAEIDKFEQECVDSFDKNMEKKNENADELVTELNDFYFDKIKFLSEFKIDETVVEEVITKADSHCKKVKIENRSLKKIQFNGRIVKFKKSTHKIDRTLLGTLVYKSLNSYVDSLNEVTFTNDVITNYESNINIFKHQNGNNFAFYVDINRNLSMTSFDNGGNVLKQVINPLDYDKIECSQISQLKVTKFLKNFVFFVRLPGYKKGAICGHLMQDAERIIGLFFILNQNFDFIKHTSIYRDRNVLYMTANSSRLICINTSYSYYFLDMNLAEVRDKSLMVIKHQVGRSIVDVQMNDKYLIFLCNDKKLKIFEIGSGNFVQEIETSANQIKLASVDRLVLFDSVERVVYLHDQTGEFSELEVINLAQSLEDGLKINCDQSKCLAFYNSKCIKCTYLD
jgi:hypothetical protein